MKDHIHHHSLSGGGSIAAEKRTLTANEVIGWILQIGVILSTALIISGLLLLPTQPGGFSAQRLLDFPQTLADIQHGLFRLRPQAIISLGLIVLIATPVIRVASSIIAFALEEDRKYVIITIIVLAILLFSIFSLGGNTTAHTPAGVDSLHYSLPRVLFIFLGSMMAGLIGALVGLGGGVLVVPMLTLLFGFPIPYAIGASIISVIATSSGAAIAYLRDHITNLRVGMFLELGTTLGAITGAFVAGYLSGNILSVVFGVILIISIMPSIFKMGEKNPQNVKNDRLAQWLHLNGSYPDEHQGKEISYEVTRTPWGLLMMYIAGAVSGLLGIGSGTFKVLALDTIMRLPIKVSTTTSNFMIGVTAAASAGIYFSRGDMPPLVAAPVALGVLIGAQGGARILGKMSNKALRIVFIIVIAISAIEMILSGLGINGF